MPETESEQLARLDERQKGLIARVETIERKLWWGIAILVANQLNEILNLVKTSGVGP